jgi:hypothetical protein
MLFKEVIEAKNNVRIVARERGKKVKSMCRESHNIWVNQGRQYLAEVISPVVGFGAHYNDSPVRVVRYMALGIGGNSQMNNLGNPMYSSLVAAYPGQNTYDDTLLDTKYLERPVKVTGDDPDPGHSDAGIWMGSVSAPPTFGGSPITKTQFDCLFTYTDINLGGYFPSVPLSEIGLMLSNEVPSRLSNEVYYYTHPPDYIQTSTRQKLVAYNTFDTINKTVSVALEVYWEIQF